jgi:hypothetical protein
MQKMFNLDDFFSELGELYGKTPTRAYRERVESMLEKVPYDRLDSIYETATELHEASTTLPTMQEIQKAIEENCTVEQSNIRKQGRLSNTDEWPVDKIIDRVKEIKGKTNVNISDVDFMCDWDMLFYCYSFLKDKEWDDMRIVNYLEPLKSRIAAGENVIKASVDRDEDFKRLGMVSFDEIKEKVI